MKAVIITGVSTGIGYSSAKLLIESGYHVFGSIRTQEDASRLSVEFGKNFSPLIFDVTDEIAINNSVKIVEDKLGNNGKLVCLINNAGIALGGPVLHLDINTFRKQFEVNLFSIVTITKAFSKLLGATKDSIHQGKIINISSVAGKRAFPFSGPYSASKHALEGLSDSLRIELKLYGIDVILVEPGPVVTNIWDKLPDPNNNEFIGTDYEPSLVNFYNHIKEISDIGLPVEVVSNKIKHIIENPKPKVRYVLTRQKFKNYWLPKILSTRIYDNIVAKFLGIKKEPN
jgi:short-subunit dehydrogenase